MNYYVKKINFSYNFAWNYSMTYYRLLNVNFNIVFHTGKNDLIFCSFQLIFSCFCSYNCCGIFSLFCHEISNCGKSIIVKIKNCSLFFTLCLACYSITLYACVFIIKCNFCKNLQSHSKQISTLGVRNGCWDIRLSTWKNVWFELFPQRRTCCSNFLDVWDCFEVDSKSCFIRFIDFTDKAKLFLQN